MSSYKNMKLKDFLELPWITYENKKTKIKDLENSHIANIIHFLSQSSNNFNTNCRLKLFNKLAKLRKLNQKYIDSSPIPHKNKENKWGTLDLETGKFSEISDFRAKIQITNTNSLLHC